jgi:hypothetical protein
MLMPSPKVFAVALGLLFSMSLFQAVLAQDIMVEEGGKPLKKEKAPAKSHPRGSSYIPSTTLPHAVPPTVGQPSPGVYTPPPIESFSDRVTRCNHSFPLNAGIGNNPTERSAYVRQCAN